MLAELSTLVRGEALSGVELALLPEAILTGYVSPRGDFDLRRFAEPLGGPTSAAIAALAREGGVALAAPLIEESGGRCYNSLILVDREGRQVGHWRKRHPWFPERWATPGDLGTPVVDLLGIRITAAICFDVHFLSEDAGAELDAADLLLFPTAWVDSPAHADLRAGLLPPLARRHGIGILNANWGPPVDPPRGPWPFSRPIPGQGGSRLLDASGRVVAQASRGAGAAIVRATLDPDRSHRRPGGVQRSGTP